MAASVQIGQLTHGEFNALIFSSVQVVFIGACLPHNVRSLYTVCMIVVVWVVMVCSFRDSRFFLFSGSTCTTVLSLLPIGFSVSYRLVLPVLLWPGGSTVRTLL